MDAFLIAAVSAVSLSATHILARSYSSLVRNSEGLLVQPPEPGTGIGVILALVGGLVAVGGAIGWLLAARYTPYFPLRTTITWTRLSGVIIALLILIGSMFASWSVDQRAETVVSAELQAQIDDLRERADEPGASATLATELLVLRARADDAQDAVYDGITAKGSQLGLWAMIAGGLALMTGFPAFNLYSYRERRLWLWSALTAGFGASAAFIGFAWIATHVRSSDINFASGVGSFFAMGAGLMIVGSVLPALRKIRRTRIYDDLPAPNNLPAPNK